MGTSPHSNSPSIKSNNIAVELRDVVKRFGEVLAVNHVSLQVQDGEFYSLLGPSGCGKTTSLRLIAGFEMASEGQVLIGGEPQGYLPPTSARSTPSKPYS